MKSRTRKSRRRQRGGDTKLHACGMPYSQGEPPTKCIGEELTDAQIKKLKEALEAVPKDITFFVLKIGSNDDPAVVGNTYIKSSISERGHSTGSKGRKEGQHYIEVPLLGSVGTNSKFTDLNQIAANQAQNFARQISKIINDKGYLLSVAPTIKHTDFQYPFGTEETEGFQKIIYNVVRERIENSEHLETFFPLTATGKNKEVLDMIIERPEPLILYNAMTSSCHTSMKYIVDMRLHAERITIYMGLADTLNNKVECDLYHPIYPDRKKSCEGVVLDTDVEKRVKQECKLDENTKKKNNINTTKKNNANSNNKKKNSTKNSKNQ